MDREIIFQWIYRKEWTNLLNFIRRDSEAVGKDPIVEQAVQTFVREFVGDLRSGEATKEHRDRLETLYALHWGKKLSLSQDLIETIIIELVRQTNDRPRFQLDYAKKAPHLPECAAVIAAHVTAERQAREQQEREHRFDGLRVTDNQPFADVDHTCSLFRSRQELEFFLAVRRVYPRMDVYPNVAVSAVIDFRGVADRLTTSQREYFFKALIDCVVFDNMALYRPRFFFELDSVFHDVPEQKERDAMKDHILKVAGCRLYRIRKTHEQAGQDEFMQMITDVMKDPS